jgi:hypothetical protein
LKTFWLGIVLILISATTCITINVSNNKKHAIQNQNSQKVETLTQYFYSQPIKKSRLKNINESCCLSEQISDLEKLALFNKSQISSNPIQADRFENIFIERYSHRTFFCAKVNVSHLPQYKTLRT